jgi:hypothetical protein
VAEWGLEIGRGQEARMHHRRVLSLVVIALCAICYKDARIDATGSPNADQLTGTWSGTWDGAGTGDFVLTLDGAADAVSGKVDVGTDGGNYSAELKSLQFDGPKMSARYDFPLDPASGSEVVLTATFTGGTAKGTWSLRQKGQSAEAAGGTWTVTKK